MSIMVFLNAARAFLPLLSPFFLSFPPAHATLQSHALFRQLDTRPPRSLFFFRDGGGGERGLNPASPSFFFSSESRRDGALLSEELEKIVVSSLSRRVEKEWTN